MSEHIVKGIVDVPQSEVGLILESGYLYMELGKWPEAQEVFRGAIALVPHSEVPHIALGHLLFAQGKFSQALKCYREALKLEPDSTMARAHLGETLMFQKKFAEGLEELNKVVTLEPEGAAADFARNLIEAHAVGCFEKLA